MPASKTPKAKAPTHKLGTVNDFDGYVITNIKTGKIMGCVPCKPVLGANREATRDYLDGKEAKKAAAIILSAFNK